MKHVYTESIYNPIDKLYYSIMKAQLHEGITVACGRSGSLNQDQINTR